MSLFNPLDHEVPAADHDAIHSLFAGHACQDTAVEVGCWVGATTRLLKDYFGRVYAVDTFLGNPADRLGAVAERVGPLKVFETFCQNLGRSLLYDVVPLVGPSLAWASVWGGSARRGAIDLLYLDADHRYEHVAADLAAWLPHVRPGGLVLCHDYGVFPGVTRAVDEALPGAEKIGFCLARWQKPQ